METTLNTILASIYFLVWVATLVWYQRKNNVWDGGSAIIISYIIYAIFSIMSLNDLLFAMTYEPLQVFPYIYLYFMLMLALSPTIFDHLHKPEEIEDPKTQMLKYIAILCVVCGFCLIPDIISNFSTGLVKLFTDTDAGEDAYAESAEGRDDAGSGITNIPAIIFNASTDIAIFIFYYFLTLKKKNVILIAALGFVVFLSMLVPVMHGQRSNTAISVMTLILGFFTFQVYYTKKIKTIARNIGIAALILISLPVLAITMSRFGDRAGASAGQFVNWYLGQSSLYFNNYGLDAGGSREGTRTCNLLLRVIDPKTPKNYNERRAKYHNMKVDDHIFTTFVGDFTIDFSPTIAVVIFVVFNGTVLLLLRKKDDDTGEGEEGTDSHKRIKLHQMLLLYFTQCICMQGGMYLFAYSDTQGLKIVTFLMLYFYLRIHDTLMKRFPKIKETTETVTTSSEI